MTTFFLALILFAAAIPAKAEHISMFVGRAYCGCSLDALTERWGQGLGGAYEGAMGRDGFTMCHVIEAQRATAPDAFLALRRQCPGDDLRIGPGTWHEVVTPYSEASSSSSSIGGEGGSFNGDSGGWGGSQSSRGSSNSVSGTIKKSLFEADPIATSPEQVCKPFSFDSDESIEHLGNIPLEG